MFRWILALHIIAIISWMAGILYLYRLLVYQAEKGMHNSAQHSLLSLMSERLYRYITMPAMAVSWIAGISMLVIQPAYWQMSWMHVKLVCVILLTLSTLHAGKLTLNFIEKTHPLPTSRSLRWQNELPTVLMVVIVIMVVIKPF